MAASRETARDPGVSLRCAPGRASRAVGNETTVANGAESPPRQELVAMAEPGAGAAVPRPSGRESLTQPREDPGAEFVGAC